MPEKRMVSRVSTSTRLIWGQVTADVSLFKTTADQPEAKFEIKREPEPEPAVPDTPAGVEEAEPVSDPLAEEKAGSLAERAAKAFGTSSAPEPVKPPKPRKGIYREDGSFLDLTEQLESITEATQLEEMKIVGFVPSASVPRVLVTGSYYLGGKDKEAHPVLAALEAGMQAHNVVGVVKWTKTSRQALGVIASTKRGLFVLQLAWPGDLLDPNPRVLAHRQVALPLEMRELAGELVGSMLRSPAIIQKQEDDAVVMRRQLRAAAEAGILDAWEAPTVPERKPVDDLQEALSASLPGADEEG